MTWHVDIIRDVETLRALEPEFGPFLAECEAANAFLTWEWLTTWLDVFGHTCHVLVVVVRDDRGQLAGVGPFKVARRFRYGVRLRQLEMIGAGEAVKPDGLDLLIRRACEKDVGDLIVATLVGRRRDWDVLALTDLVPDSATLGILDAGARRAALPHRATPDRICPYIRLPRRWSELEARLGKSFNRHLKRGTRRLFDELGVTFELLRAPSPEEVSNALADLATLHQDRMENTDRGGNFRKPDYRAFHLALAQRLGSKGELVFAFLRLGSQRIAARYGFLYGRTYYAYQSGFDRRYEQHSPGTVLLSCLIRHLIDAGFEEFNFLRGDQPHKYQWTTLDRRTQRFQAWAGPRGYWVWLNFVLRANAKLAGRWWQDRFGEAGDRHLGSTEGHYPVGRAARTP
jgi:CelD/BcsL family acetyltransferase involved in cellulose biosynthesis